MNALPSIKIDEVKFFGKKVYVVRDDLLPGGTKQRGVVNLVQEFKDQGMREIVYASPFCGFAQVALAYCCRLYDLKCEIFCEEDKTPQSPAGKIHRFTELALSYGANIVLTKSLREAEEKAEEYSFEKSFTTKLPLGFSCPSFHKYYRDALKVEWANLLLKTKSHPKKLWLPVGSGTLAQSFVEVLPANTRINAINVRVLSDSDERLAKLASHKSVTVFDSSQEFHSPFQGELPFPSNVFYDAKIYNFLEGHAEDGDVWWNVAQ